jgi:lysylphosphatidylglycerol synthetase-like protein (DUF2156 family)
MKNSPKSLNLLKTSQVLFYLNTIIWVVLGISSLVNTPTNTPLFIGVMIFGNAGAMLICGLGLGKEKKGFYILALMVLVVNIILTFTDEVGFLDYATFGIDLVLLIILILDRKRYLSVKPV